MRVAGFQRPCSAAGLEHTLQTHGLKSLEEIPASLLRLINRNICRLSGACVCLSVCGVVSLKPLWLLQAQLCLALLITFMLCCFVTFKS